MCKTYSIRTCDATHAGSPGSLRVVAYVRCAIDDADRMTAQATQIQHYAQRRGWELTCIYADNGQSGNSSNRPELQRLQHDIEAGLVNIVIVERFDRLYRNLQGLLGFVQLLNHYNLTLISLSEGIAFPTPWDNLARYVLNSLAEKDPGRQRPSGTAGATEIEGE